MAERRMQTVNRLIFGELRGRGGFFSYSVDSIVKINFLMVTL
jgi:hypothetical protein